MLKVDQSPLSVSLLINGVSPKYKYLEIQNRKGWFTKGERKEHCVQSLKKQWTDIPGTCRKVPATPVYKVWIRIEIKGKPYILLKIRQLELN